MKFDREAKNMIAILAFVAAIALGMNAIVAEDPSQSFISWSVGLFVVAVLFWIWIRRDDIAEARSESLKAAEEAARQAEELAKKTKDKAQAEHENVKAVAKEAVAKVEITVEETTKAVKEKVEETIETVEEQVKAVVEPVKEVTKDVPQAVASDEPDDLSKIEGIGPVYQQILKDAGVATFAAIATSSQDKLEKIIKDAGKRRPASIETWSEQAALAAKGDWDGLQKLQASLDGGRRK